MEIVTFTIGGVVLEAEFDDTETAREVVDPGTVAFWVEGSCLCLFWGPTPAAEARNAGRRAR